MTSTQVYNLAQAFYPDTNGVKNALQIDISAIALYFNQKPTATGNKSGINNPGISLFLVPLVENKPDISGIVNGSSNLPFARAEYNDIYTSGSASQKTMFRFSTPVPIETSKKYAFVLRYDGNENFVPWKNKVNDILLGSNTASTGATGSLVGPYFETIYVDPNNLNAVPTWSALAGTTLKFEIYIARYFVNNAIVTGANAVSNTTPIYGIDTSSFANVSTSSDGTIFKVSTNHYEYISFNGKNSSYANILGAETVYQDGPYFPGGSANGVSINVRSGNNLITANSLYPNGSAFKWSDVFQSSLNEYITIISANHYGANTRATNICRVVSIESNTVLLVDKYLEFSNTAAFFRKSPIAKISAQDTLKLYDVTAAGMVNSKVTQNALMLRESSANASVRFVNNSISNITISSGGTGYSNSDYIKFFGYENNSYVVGGYPAIANVITNGNGVISAIHISNTGAGFINTANINAVVSRSNVSISSVTNSTANTSNGTGLTATYAAESKLYSEYYGSTRGGGYFSNTYVINIPVNQVGVQANFNNMTGSKFEIDYENPYYLLVNPNTFIGTSFHYDTTRKTLNLEGSDFVDISGINQAIIPSKSNEFTILNDATGLSSNTPPAGSGVIDFTGLSNNDFVEISPKTLSLAFSHYAINNDYTNEHTNYGSADAKFITKKIGFESGKYAEDAIAYLTAYRPQGTDIKLYARIHNSNDLDAFDDKDWTLMEVIDGNIYSSTTDPSNYIQMTFGFPQYPNTAFTLAGSVSIADVANVTVTGSESSFSTNATANLQVNDLIKIYSPLFPTDHYWITVVSSVANDSSFTITDPISNTGVIGSGLMVDLLGRIGNTTVATIGYPFQAFNNQPNENVVRYYTSGMSPVDTYNTMQMKIVLLSNSNITASNQSIPKVDDIRVVGVSS